MDFDLAIVISISESEYSQLFRESAQQFYNLYREVL